MLVEGQSAERVWHGYFDLSSVAGWGEGVRPLSPH